jgi:RNA polymerase sigma-70 factor (ECF subfamily)
MADSNPGERAERFRQVFETCFQPLLVYARRRSDATAADDIVAETFLVAWRRLEDVPKDHPLPWLYSVAHKSLGNYWRGRGRQERLTSLLGSLRAVPEYTDASRDPDPVLVALGELSQTDQEVLRLATWEELTNSEIAVVLGCSENAAALRLSRARRRLRRELTSKAGSRTQEGWRRSDA